MAAKQKKSAVADDGGPGGSTRQVRVKSDVAEWLGWIYDIEGVESSELLDPLVRGPVLARYKRIEADVEKVKRTRAEGERLKEEARKRLRREGREE